MVNQETVVAIVAEVLRQLQATGNVELPNQKDNPAPPEFEDIVSPECRAIPLLQHPEDPDALARMLKRTTARIGVGSVGPRLKTQTMLTLRADHAQARDAVFVDVDQKMLESLGLLTIQTRCEDKNTYITRPDLGRTLSPDAIKALKERCIPNPDVQIYAADGLSSTAIEVNLPKILPILQESLAAKGLKVAPPFFLRFGRVGSEDHVAEITGAKVVCVLIGERPGLATAESMSAYLAYNAYVGMPEAKRTVVSNIHRNGTAAVEAGAYVAEVVSMILDQQASGVDLVK